MEYTKKAQNSNKNNACQYLPLLPYLDVMEHSAKRMDEVLYAKAYYRVLYDDAFTKVMAEIGGVLINIEHLSRDPTTQIEIIRKFIRSASLAASLDAKLTAKNLKAKNFEKKI